jgi:hypothetical protein
MVIDNVAGGYAYIGGLRFASGGVVARPGTAIERAVLEAPAPGGAGYDAVRGHLERAGRPIAALCGLELRLPASLPLDGFRTFNDGYLARLDAWGLLRDGVSPLARTNVSPVADAPDEPVVVAFSYTVERDGAASGSAPDFVISGVADIPDGGTYPDDIVRRGETSPGALLAKARSVAGTVADRTKELGALWDGSAEVQLYTPYDLAFVVQRDVLRELGVVPRHGLTWHDAWPPTRDLELEIDVRRTSRAVTARVA